MSQQSVEQLENAQHTHSRYARFKRWMYRGDRPGRLARLVNRGYALAGAIGLTPNFLVMLEVTGRKSGQAITFPVAVVPISGQRYVVSMLGETSQWVKNVRAAGGAATLHSGGRRPIHLEEISPDRRAPILKAYLNRAPGARPHIPVGKDAPLAEFEDIAGDYPVFRIDPPEAKSSTQKS